MLSTLRQRPNLAVEPSLAGYRMFERDCGTDEDSDSEIGETLLPPYIFKAKSPFRTYNTVETKSVTAARQVCAYFRCCDPSKYPVAPNTLQIHFDRYDESHVSLPRCWCKELPFSDPFCRKRNPYWPYTFSIFLQARSRDPSKCKCLHFLPSIIDNNAGYFVIDFACGCCHATGNFGPILEEHNSSPKQLAALGRSPGPGFKIQLSKIRQVGGLYCPVSNSFYLCPSRSLRRHPISAKNKRPKARKVGSKLCLTDRKYHSKLIKEQAQF